MKIAVDQAGKAITAGEDAPSTAICPYCKGTVTLRTRRSSYQGDLTYFWRHLGRSHPRCPARFNPVTTIRLGSDALD